MIEDTGKLWPTQDLKVGLLVSSRHVGLPLQLVHSDILLGVSPFVLALVRSFAQDAADGGLSHLHTHIAANRQAVREALESVPSVTFPDEDSRVSVERIEVAEWDCRELWAALRTRGVDVLPCSQFPWADDRNGGRCVRLALARDHDLVLAGVRQLRELLEERA